MKTSGLLKTGLIGMVVFVLCCFTPLLVVLLGVVGLAAWVRHLDVVLMPALIMFTLLTLYALLRRNREAG